MLLAPEVDVDDLELGGEEREREEPATGRPAAGCGDRLVDEVAEEQERGQAGQQRRERPHAQAAPANGRRPAPRGSAGWLELRPASITTPAAAPSVADPCVAMPVLCVMVRADTVARKYQCRPVARAARAAGRARCYAWSRMFMRPPASPQPSQRPMTQPRTLVEKIWDDHVVARGAGRPGRSSPSTSTSSTRSPAPRRSPGSARAAIGVRRPDKTVATADHSTPTTPGTTTRRPKRGIRSLPMVDNQAAAQIERLEANCAEFGIPIHAFGSDTQGIVHVIGPELGLTQPGMTIVCGDSHTATHGAFGALAFGIGTSEVEMVLATQTLLQRQPKTYEVRVDGRLSPGVTRQGHHPRADRARSGSAAAPGTCSSTAARPSARSTWSSG